MKARYNITLNDILKEVKEEQQRKIEVEEFYKKYLNKNEKVKQLGFSCCCKWIEVTCIELD